MRVLLVVQNYLPFIGGIETHAQQVAHALVGMGHGVRIVAGNFTPYRGSQRLGTLYTSLTAPRHADYSDGPIPVHALTPRGADRIKMLPIALRALPRVQRYAFHKLHAFGYPWYRGAYLARMRKWAGESDVVHALASSYIGWLAQEAAAGCNVPFVCTPFCHPGQWGDGPPDIRYYRRANAVIGLVETDRQYLVSLGVPRERLHVIGVSPALPPRCDPAGFRARHGWTEQPVVL